MIILHYSVVIDTLLLCCRQIQSSQSKLEKADILEMTVKHLRNNQRLHRQLSQCTFSLLSPIHAITDRTVFF